MEKIETVEKCQRNMKIMATRIKILNNQNATLSTSKITDELRMSVLSNSIVDLLDSSKMPIWTPFSDSLIFDNITFIEKGHEEFELLDCVEVYKLQYC